MNTENFVEICTRNLKKKHTNPINDEIVLVFDIDNCLYNSKELVDHEESNIKKRFLELANGNEEDWFTCMTSFKLYREIFHSLFKVHPSDFTQYYEIPQLHSFIQPDQELKEMLQKIKFRKFCFTNACKKRAAHILSYLGILDLFESIICADTMETEFICKPMQESYSFLEEYLGIKNKEKIYFFDDTLKNIEGAKRAGWNAIHVQDDIKKYISELVNQLENQNEVYETIVQTQK